MKNCFKRVAAMILAFCFSLIFSNVLNAAVFSQSNYMTVFLNSEVDVDLSGVVVNVYKKINIVPLSERLNTFEVEYIGSAISNSEGKISFEKPSEPFMIEFDLETLPAGTGLKKQSISYNQSMVQSEDVNLYSVVSAEAYFAGDDLNFCFKDSDNENLIVGYEIDSHRIANVDSAKLSEKTLAEKYSGGIDCTLVHSGNVSVNGMPFPYSVNESYSDLNYLQYISLLYDKGCITKDEQTLMLCKFLESDYGESYRTGEMKDILQIVKSESLDATVRQNIDGVLSRISEQSYVKNIQGLLYVETTISCSQGINCCEGGTHKIRVYHSARYSDAANQVLNHAVSIFDYFVNQLGFACPRSVDYTSDGDNVGHSFCIVLSPLEGAVGYVTFGYYKQGFVNKQAAYVVLDCDASDAFGTGLAHEFQHCIQNQYNLTGKTDLWWKESCANWAAMLYAEDVLGDLSTRWDEYDFSIEGYLQTTKLSLAKPQSELEALSSLTLDQKSRPYSVLFPMLLAQMNDDEITIRSIYEEVKSIRAMGGTMTSQQIFTAIDNVIVDSTLYGYDLRYELEFFGKVNYNPSSYYNFWKSNFNTSLIATRQDLSLNSQIEQWIDPVGYGYYILNPSPESVTISIQVPQGYEDFTCWTREGFREVHYVKEHKHRFTSNRFYLEYTFQSTLGEYLILIVENTSTNDSDISTNTTDRNVSITVG